MFKALGRWIHLVAAICAVDASAQVGTGTYFSEFDAPGGGGYLVTGDFGQPGPPIPSFSFVQFYESVWKGEWPYEVVLTAGGGFWQRAAPGSNGQVAAWSSLSGVASATVSSMRISDSGLPLSRFETYLGSRDIIEFNSTAPTVDVTFHYRFVTTNLAAQVGRGGYLEVFTGLDQSNVGTRHAWLGGSWNNGQVEYVQSAVNGVESVTVSLPTNVPIWLLSTLSASHSQSAAGFGSFEVESGLLGIEINGAATLRTASGLSYALAPVDELPVTVLLAVGLIGLAVRRRWPNSLR